MIRLGCMVLATLLLSNSLSVQAVGLVPTDNDSVKNAAKAIATDMMSYYTGGQNGVEPGILPGNGQVGGYYWWIGGGMFGTLVNYWYHTGDTTWVNDTLQAIVYQSAPDEGGYFEPKEQNLQLGNDDQAFWGMTAMMAAEYNFPNPPEDQPQYLEMVQGLFNRQNARWDPETCNGGLRWQVFPLNTGYDYKNSISNGAFFNIAARLAKYTGNQTYADAAARTFDWSVSELLINATTFEVIDGIRVDTCNSFGHGEQWTYNVGVYLYGAAAMWNHTQDPVWQARTEGLLSTAMRNFLYDNGTSGPSVLTEVICEPYDLCKVDQSSFKAYLARWMTATAKVAPFTAQKVYDALLPSAEAAAVSCSGPGGNGGVQCGEKWYLGQFDGKTGIGMQMCAMEVIQTLIDRPGPITAITGGTSVGDPTAGTGPTVPPGPTGIINVTAADRGGAWFLTVLLATATIGGGFWMMK